MNQVVKKILGESKPYKEADFLESIFGSYSEAAISGKLPVVLFGAGAGGLELYPNMVLHGVHPVCFCDNNTSRVGTTCAGIPVISFEALNRNHMGELIVVATNVFLKEIKEKLLANGFPEDKILSEGDPRTFYYMFFFNHHLTMDELYVNEGLICEIYNLLADQDSKDIFIKRMALFSQGADYSAFQEFLHLVAKVPPGNPSSIEGYMYYNNDLIHLREGEVLVDAGAYPGDSVEEFVKACERSNVKYNDIYCFEPDLENHKTLLKNVLAYRNVTCFQSGLWSSAATLRFFSSAQIEAGACRIIDCQADIIPKTTDSEIKVVSLDEQIGDKNITLIKMDIEGSEIEALYGSANIIKKNRPRLIISVYHKKDDLYMIPILVHRLRPDYKLYLRHLNVTLYDTVLIAI